MHEPWRDRVAELEQAQCEAAIGEAGLSLRTNRQPYCSLCGEVIPPSVEISPSTAEHCKACQTQFDPR